MSCDVAKGTEGFENELWRRWIDGTVGEWSLLCVWNVLRFGVGRIACCYSTTPLHIALSLSKRNFQGNMSFLPHPPYAHDFAPCDFFSFPAWKRSYVGVDFIRPKRSWLPREKPYGTLLPTCFSGASRIYPNVGRRTQWPTATIWREDVNLFKSMPSYAASCVTFRFLCVPTLQASVSKLNDCSSILF